MTKQEKADAAYDLWFVFIMTAMYTPVFMFIGFMIIMHTIKCLRG